MFCVDQLFGVPGIRWKASTANGEANSRLIGTDMHKAYEKYVKSPIHYICGLLLTLIPLQNAYAVDGVITEGLPECSYFLVKADEGYAVMEWNGENKPSRNDRLHGTTFSSGSMQVLDNATKGNKVKVWVEGYPMSYDEGMSIYRAECPQ